MLPTIHHIFAKIGDIKGESLDSKHKDEVEVLSWSWGVQQSGAMGHGGGGSEGKATFNDFNFTHHVDKASPVLLKACATGEHIKEATITVRKADKGQQEFLIIKMNDIIITSVNPSGHSEGGVTAESVAFQFAKVDLEYKPQDEAPDARAHFKLSAPSLAPAKSGSTSDARSARVQALIERSRRSGVESLVDVATEMALAEPMDQVELEREGLPAVVLAGLAQLMAVPRVRLFEMMNLPRATMEKKISDDEVLTGDANRRALNLVRLLAHAHEILKDSTSAEAERFDVARWLGRWIETPQPALGGKKPADLLDTETGASMVERTLGAMRSGAYL
jgi:type VI secretion system secreted protein Hcp